MKKPQHIAIILDGNRRWAKRRGLEPFRGHEQGVKALEKIIDHCLKRGISHLTVYVFSTENWKRSRLEVGALMKLLEKYLREQAEELNRKKIKLNIFGDKDGLPKNVRQALDGALDLTKKNKRLNLNLALNYGGRAEITRAVKLIAARKISAKKISQKTIEANLYSTGQPDPDLIIRTGGEIRLSNFLLWQAAYSELYFVKKFWPDFGPKDLDKAVLTWQKRQRRYGG